MKQLRNRIIRKAVIFKEKIVYCKTVVVGMSYFGFVFARQNAVGGV